MLTNNSLGIQNQQMSAYLENMEESECVEEQCIHFDDCYGLKMPDDLVEEMFEVDESG